MRSKDSITATTVVAVDPDTAFRVFTAELGQWWRRGPRYAFGTRHGGQLVLEPRVGGALLEIGPDGETGAIARVTAWEPGRRVVLAWLGVDLAPAPATQVEITFESAPRGTRVTVEHRGWDRLPADHPLRGGIDDGAYLDAVGLRWADRLVAFAAAAARG
jgi:uncharacterized protein YndB with AHSA1/START domain